MYVHICAFTNIPGSRSEKKGKKKDKDIERKERSREREREKGREREREEGREGGKEGRCILLCACYLLQASCGFSSLPSSF